MLFARSLRQRGGPLARLPIFSFQPRAGRPLAGDTLEHFDHLEIQHVHERINRRFAADPLGNKPLVCAWAEEHLPYDVLIFSDSDTVVLGPPTELALADDVSIAVRPADLVGVGVSSTDATSKKRQYWDQLYGVAGADEVVRGAVTTTVDERRIDSYWNSGLMAVRRDAGICCEWRRVYAAASDWGLRPPGAPQYLEQSSFAVAVRSIGGRIKTLPRSYNYPLHLHSRIGHGGRLNLAEATTVHYHRMFGEERPFLSRGIEPGPDSKWLRDEALALGVRAAGASA